MNAAEALIHIQQKYRLDLSSRSPIEIPDMGRDNLPSLFNELGYTRGVEVGTERGLYAEVLCSTMPNLHLTCVDLWKTHDGYYGHQNQRRLDKYHQEAQARLAPFNCTLLQAYSMDAVQQFEDASLDFVYIDANHRIPAVLDDICAWQEKVRPGGIVAGHDYYESRRTFSKCHVKYAVDCATRAFRIKPWFIIGLKEKRPGLIRDKSRSWFWVVEDVRT